MPTNPSTQPKDSFAGAWLVREYVYDSKGVFLGTIRQRRQLKQTEEGILVIQDCECEPKLIHHPMGAFTGHWVFLLHPSGQQRYYKGPDVIGSGFMWEKGIMTGQGLWPRFGYSFSSYAVMSTPDRQCTGGSFSRIDHTVASITGIAVPESSGSWPELAHNVQPSEIAYQWIGTAAHYDSAGSLLKNEPVQRIYKNSEQFYDEEPSRKIQITRNSNGEVKETTNKTEFQGLYQRYGSRLESTVWNTNRTYRREILDPITQQLFIINVNFQTHQLYKTEIIRLKAS